MSPKAKSILQIFIFSGLGVLLVWLSLKDISWNDIKTAFGQANYFWVVVCAIVGILSHISRAIRWRILLEALDYKPSLQNTFFAVMVGYLANYGIPRMGEVTRCTVLTKYEKIPFTEGFGTVITERIIDVLCLGIILVLTLVFQFNEFIGICKVEIFHPISLRLSPLLEQPFWVMMFAAILLFIFIAFFLLRKKIKKLFSGKLGGIVKGFVKGLQSIRHLQRPYQFIAHSIFIWLMYFLGIYVCFFCFPETSHLGWKECLSLLLCGSFGVMITTGGLGAYQYILQRVLAYYSISIIISNAFPWIVWGTGFLLILVLGLISLILLPLLNKTKDAAT